MNSEPVLVRSAMGDGFQEVIYQRALAHELQGEGVSFDRECEMPVFYYGVQMGKRRVDLLVGLNTVSGFENSDSMLYGHVHDS